MSDKPKEFDTIQIEYSVFDRFQSDHEHGEPDAIIQHMTGKVTGEIFDHVGMAGTREVIGRLSFCLIDRWEARWPIVTVLDAHSEELAEYARLFHSENAKLVEAREETRKLLILEDLMLVPEARGQDIGLHVLARTILTWGEDAIVALVASPVEGTLDSMKRAELEDESMKQAREKIAQHWCKLGLTRLRDRQTMPMLWASTHTVALDKKLRSHLWW
jgi:GNAT superfamily N-acetyltransferase